MYNMVTPNIADNEDTIKALIASMSKNGWVGAPLVKDEGGEELFTGSHRYHVWVKVLDFDPEDIPMIGVVDLFEEAGLSYVELMQDCDCCINMIKSAIPTEKYKEAVMVLDAYGWDIC